MVEVPVDPALGGPTTVFVKRYRYEHFEQRIKQAFRGTLFGESRARREFEFLSAMRNRQIPTVRPIAYGEDYGRVFLRASFLITEGAEGFQSLDLFGLNTLRDKPLKKSQRREITQELAATIRKMHQAGIRHGGLYWRNILIRAKPDRGYQFLLIDPDTSGRMSASQVPESAVVSDLSKVVASAMALGQRAGLLALMTAYFQVSRLSLEQRQLTSRIIERAKTLAPSERRRMAITDAIGWLRRRTANAHGGIRPARAFRCVDDFFGEMSSCTTVPTLDPQASKSIRFSFTGKNEVSGALDRTVIMSGEQVEVSAVRPLKHDLVIRTDPETWLAVISGQADTYTRLREGRLRMEGDPTLLSALMEHLDRKEPTILPIEARTK